MASPFRYVFEDCLYLGFSQAMPLDDGKKFFGITCPDFVENYFEVVETGDKSSPYLPKSPVYFNPFSQAVIEWFSDHKLLWD
jgi:hypothetical protein